MALVRKTVLKIKGGVTMATKPEVRRPFTVIVEGNIGSGKTTFINHFKKYNDICLLSEPVEMWRNCGGDNLLKLMYEDTEKWTFTFQSYVQLTMLQQHIKETPHPVKIMERSLYSARYCFIENMVNNGLLPLPSKSVLNEWFKWCISHKDLSVDLVVYLRTSPEVVFERIKGRKRLEEKVIKLEYLKQLHDLHDDWLYYKKIFSCPAPVIAVNADLDEVAIIEEYQKFEPSILKKQEIGLVNV